MKWLRLKEVQIVMLILLGVFLVYLSIRKIAINDLIDQIYKGHYWIALPVFSISMVGYLFRSLRWKLIFKSMDTAVSTSNLYAALSIGYAVNFATPRLGEISRCLVLKKTDDIPLEQSIISVIAERVVDFCCLLLVVILASFVHLQNAQLFFNEQIFQPITQSINLVSGIGYIVFFSIIMGVLFFVLRKQQSRFAEIIRQAIVHIRQVIALKEKALFFLYTLLIWCCYFLMTYLWFDVFDETKVLGLREALVIMAVGSIGRSVPIQGGGMGAYHYLVSNVFVIFGLSMLTGNAMAFVIHGAQMILTLLLGALGWLWIIVKTKNDD